MDGLAHDLDRRAGVIGEEFFICEQVVVPHVTRGEPYKLPRRIERCLLSSSQRCPPVVQHAPLDEGQLFRSFLNNGELLSCFLEPANLHEDTNQGEAWCDEIGIEFQRTVKVRECILGSSGLVMK